MRGNAAAGDVLEVDWLGVCRRSAAALREMLSSVPTTLERDRGTGLGAGGDTALLIDRRAEDAVFAELDALHRDGLSFTAVSEERGEVSYGSPADGPRVVIDPIDGSLNAKRLMPTFALSVAVASGDTMEDVEFGYVHDFGTEEEWVAYRRQGAALNGIPVDIELPDRGLELVGFEAARPNWIAPVATTLGTDAYRMRIVGSIAVTLCYVAVSRLDGMLTTNTCRSVDAAAAQLIVREAGGLVTVLGHGGLEAPLDLEARYRIAAARTPEGLEKLVRALTEAGLPPA